MNGFSGKKSVTCNSIFNSELVYAIFLIKSRYVKYMNSLDDGSQSQVISSC